MLRSVLSELFPNWVKRDVIREQRSSGSLTALQSLQRRIRLADKTKPHVNKPEAPCTRSAKADADRKDTSGWPNASNTSGTPVRDVRENPAPNPGKPGTAA
jgi:hypothetical protein